MFKEITKVSFLTLSCLVYGADSTLARPMRRCRVGPVVSVSVAGDRVYLGAQGGVLIIGVGDPNNPRRLGELPTLDIVYSLIPVGDKLYLANGKDGLAVLDVSDPASPYLLGGLDTPGFAYDLVVRGDYLYLADGDSGLVVLGIKNPAEPGLISRLAIPGRVFAIELGLRYGYLAGLGGLYLVDLDDPYHPIPAGYYPAGWIYDLAVDEPYIYLASDYLGLQVFKLSEDLKIEPLTQVLLPGYLYGLEINDDRLYLACNGAGLAVADLSDPAQPRIIGSGGVLGWTRRVSIQGDYAYLASGRSGLRVMELKNLKEVGCYEIP